MRFPQAKVTPSIEPRNFEYIVSIELKAEIGEIIFLSNFLAKRIKSQKGRN